MSPQAITVRICFRSLYGCFSVSPTLCPSYEFSEGEGPQSGNYPTPINNRTELSLVRERTSPSHNDKDTNHEHETTEEVRCQMEQFHSCAGRNQVKQTQSSGCQGGNDLGRGDRKEAEVVLLGCILILDHGHGLSLCTMFIEMGVYGLYLFLFLCYAPIQKS